MSVPCAFSSWVVLFFTVEFFLFFSLSIFKSLSDTWFANIFFPRLYTFVSLNRIFLKGKSSTFDKVQFINFTFYGLFLLSSLRNLCLAQESEDFPLFFSKFYSFPFYIQSPLCICCCYSVTKSCRTLWPRALQHARLPCPSLFPGVCSN